MVSLFVPCHFYGTGLASAQHSHIIPHLFLMPPEALIVLSSCTAA